MMAFGQYDRKTERNDSDISMETYVYDPTYKKSIRRQQ